MAALPSLLAVLPAVPIAVTAGALSASAAQAGETKGGITIDPFKRLPIELFVPICTYLSDREVSVDMSRVNKLWHRASSHDAIWKNKFIEEFVYETDGAVAKQKAEAKVIQECITRGVCTITVTKRDYLMQQIYICNTCIPPRQRMSALIGCCTTCATKCHAGHAIVKGPNDLFYCDCGSHDFGVDIKEPTICHALPIDYVEPTRITMKPSSSSSSLPLMPPVLSKVPSSAVVPSSTKLVTTSSGTTSATHSVDGKAGGINHVKYCTMCTQIAVRPVTTNGCDHIMCYTCISSWTAVRQSCPLCKQQFTALLDHSVASQSSLSSGALSSSSPSPLVIPLTVMSHARHARVPWRIVFKEQWISERNDARGWTAYFQAAFREYPAVQKFGWIGLDAQLWYRSRRFRLTTLETKAIVSRLRDDNRGGTITIGGVTYYVMIKQRGPPPNDSYILHGRNGIHGVWMESTIQGVIIAVYSDIAPIVIAPSLAAVLPVTCARAITLAPGVAQHSVSVGYGVQIIATHIRTNGS